MSVAMRSSSGVVRTSPASALPASTPPTVADADEPRPRASGIRLCMTIRQPTPSFRSPRAARRVVSRPRTKWLSWSAVSSPSPSPSIGQVDLAPAPDPDLELDRVGHGEGQPQAVVAGAEVGRRGRHLHGDPAAVELGEPTCVHRPLPYQPSATATEPMVGAASRNGQDLALGSARILEAVPGQHAHDGRRRVELAGRRGLGHAGHARRRGRLAEDALVARQGAVGRQDLVVGHGRDPAARGVPGVDRLRPRRRIADPDGGRDRLGLLDPVADDDRCRAGGLEAPHPRPGGHDAGGLRTRGSRPSRR